MDPFPKIVPRNMQVVDDTMLMILLCAKVSTPSLKMFCVPLLMVTQSH